jgi:hypothetical protein
VSQFWIPDEESEKLCRNSRDHKKPTSVSGVDTISGKVRFYTGVVQSVEDNGAIAPQGRRWRVTMWDILE